MLTDPFFLFAIGNIIGCIGTLPLMFRVYKNREKLAGYDLVGSSLTLSSIVFFLLGFISARNTVNAILISFTLVYWLLVVVLKLIMKYSKQPQPIIRLGYDENGNKTC